MNVSAVVLAGGLGTRLRAALPDLPKCMAPIAGRPFLDYLISFLAVTGIRHCIFALGYAADKVIPHLDRLRDQYPGVEFDYSVEEYPLGTGGALLQASGFSRHRLLLVFNGDTYFLADIPALLNFHRQHGAGCTITLKYLADTARYGQVEIGSDHRITGFREKGPAIPGWINGGIYAMEASLLKESGLQGLYSLERELLPWACRQEKLFGFKQEGYFIDIGVPEDYARARKELPQHAPMFDLQDIDRNWTLFLDRDGVLNEEREPYVMRPEDFQFYPGVPEALVKLGRVFGRIIVVTNQRGIGRGLMTTDDLEAIHAHMLGALRAAGAKIDAIYYCPADDDSHPERKPNPGMAFRAASEFPGLDLTRSLIVGNNISDMDFGRNAGMHTVLLNTTGTRLHLPDPRVDLQFPGLPEFARVVEDAVAGKYSPDTD